MNTLNCKNKVKKHYLKITIKNFIKMREEILDEAIRFGLKFSQKAKIDHHYMDINLDSSYFVIDYFLYNDYPDDDNVDSVRVPYDALFDKDEGIKKILDSRNKERKFEELLDLKSELSLLKEDKNRNIKRYERLIKQCNKLEEDINILIKEH